MRFVAPARSKVDPAVFERPPLASWREYGALLREPQWPGIAALNALRNPQSMAPRFVEQTPKLLGDGLHYEQRIADHGAVATRAGNWHDLLNALVWLRYPQLKSALNARQVAEIAVAGPKRRTRAQCALTHFDEAGVVVLLRDPALLAAWDAHDWHGLFRRERSAWTDGRIAVHVFGHALLEHALRPHQLVVGKALVVRRREQVEKDTSPHAPAVAAVARAIATSAMLADPQELRPLPLSGIPGWHADSDSDAFYRDMPCFRPLRPGRRYPPALAGDGQRS